MAQRTPTNPIEPRRNTMTAKTVNYTAEQTASMIADYQAGVTVDSIAAAMGKSVRSVIAKLSREKVYVTKERTTKTGEKVVKKDILVDTMQLMFGLTDAEADSLTKANKTALQKILQKWAKEAATNMTVVDMTDGAFDAD
jgi:hypothetical protein